MRRLIAFDCDGDRLAATLDPAPGATGLLIVSGGNELRIGTGRGMAMLAAAIAACGAPVFRYDRRGVGDSTGSNRGFARSRDDLIAAAAAFRAAAPHVTCLLGFGNCDGATTLALHGAAAGVDALLLANPWLVEPAGDAPPAAAIRARYADRLADPAQWLRLLRGGVDLRKLAGGLRTLLRPAPPTGDLASQVATALHRHPLPTTLLLARRDNTAIACASAWRSSTYEAIRARVLVIERDTASHGFLHDDDPEWLIEQVAAALARLEAGAVA